MREGIKKKAAAHNRKQNKLAKKDVTWKSKQKKDPGIPASFPYKDRIVSEIEESKRAHAEEKLRRKAERKAQLAAAGENPDLVDDEEDDEEESNPLGALLESAQQAAKEYNGEDSDEDLDDEDESDLEIVEYDLSEDEDEDSELDKSRKAYDKIFKSVVEASDVVLYVLDARDPEGTRSKKVEQAVLQSQGKRLILLLNKVDLIPNDVLNKWLDFLKSSFPTIPIRAAPGATNSNSYNKTLSQTTTANNLLTALKSYAAKSNLKRSIITGVIGYPNVGKSSIINALTSRHGGSSKACPTGNQAGVTTSLREVKIDGKLKILDSPGIVFPAESKKKSRIEQEAHLALLSALPPKNITDPYPAIVLLLKKLSKSQEMIDHFKTFYQLPPLPNSDVNEFAKQVLIHVARKRGRLGKGGIPNLSSAGLSILNDWRDGKLIGWTLPKSSKETANDHLPKTAAAGNKPSESVEQTTIVSQWSKEFDLDGLFASIDNQNDDAMEE
ncbi:Nuclear GTP-binding protein NUG1 [Wickerhamomyces ciferrii]|uniref:Nuclear GTP-binding protein NUG1 n=1 Tax=Wickerhamomyces ciferrii (strain ATCC 14091 / BCRC 22168 / CBS 111 / JCM 3599 / NBRC 0793 / NRRL Y-1031 F-60-10) TaxID=1206466 RepID=K0KKD0_WICCF|nr:Nuclear GTP-binding protein NUG1 [Wickerhamomyces ciferrii]CCH41578.1 Nuclear GTP-binding protein NUG1 [Wickerhamomyces ciferrii]